MVIWRLGGIKMKRFKLIISITLVISLLSTGILCNYSAKAETIETEENDDFILDNYGVYNTDYSPKLPL